MYQMRLCMIYYRAKRDPWALYAPHLMSFTLAQSIAGLPNPILHSVVLVANSNIVLLSNIDSHEITQGWCPQHPKKEKGLHIPLVLDILPKLPQPMSCIYHRLPHMLIPFQMFTKPSAQLLKTMDVLKCLSIYLISEQSLNTSIDHTKSICIQIFLS